MIKTILVNENNKLIPYQICFDVKKLMSIKAMIDLETPKGKLIKHTSKDTEFLKSSPYGACENEIVSVAQNGDQYTYRFYSYLPSKLSRFITAIINNNDVSLSEILRNLFAYRTDDFSDMQYKKQILKSIYLDPSFYQVDAKYYVAEHIHRILEYMELKPNKEQKEIILKKIYDTVLRPEDFAFIKKNGTPEVERKGRA